MKKQILTLAALAILVGTASNAYSQVTDKKSEKARENLVEKQNDVVEAKKELKEAKQDSISDYQKFKKDSEVRIKNNEKDIADLKAKLVKENKKNKAEYQKKVNAVEVKNSELKKTLNNYKEEGPDKWTAFKNNFNNTLDEIGKSMKDFASDKNM
jgi:phage-related minor tail protein